MRNVVLLGSTGSIGTSTIKVAEDLPDKIRLLGLAAGNNVELLLEQTRKHRPAAISITDPAKARELRDTLGTSTEVFSGTEGLVKLATLPGADIVLIAIVGTAGLEPALAAIRAGKDIAIASKEILVMAGEIVMREAREHGVNVLAVESEHSAIFQCLDGKPAGSVRRLFDIEMGRVSVVVHPQSVVHSMVEFVDGSMLAQLSTPDMCLPIQYALTYPDRAPSQRVQTSLAKLGTLTFEEPDSDRFPALELARQAGEVGGTLRAGLNAANEVAVEAFLNRRVSFTDISAVVRRTMEQPQPVPHASLEQILAADAWARAEAGRG